MKKYICLTAVMLSFFLHNSVYAQIAGNVTDTFQSGFGGQQDMPINNLACNYPVFGKLGMNRAGTFIGDGFNLTLGIDTNFGGVGTGISFLNQSNQKGINILQNISAAGAGWQNSYMINNIASDTLILFNQGAGNSANMQWGFSNRVKNLTQIGWNPLYADHVNTNFTITGVDKGYGLTPCSGTEEYQFDEGRSSIVTHPIETSEGKVFHIINTFQTRSLVDQWWNFRNFEQALYLDAKVAKDHNLRVYIHKKDGSNIGPFNMFNSYSSKDGSSVMKCTSSDACEGNIGQGADYLFLIWDVEGKDIALVIRAKEGHDITWITSVPVAAACDQSDRYACGSIQIHTWMMTGGPVTIKPNEITTNYVEYYVGQPSQLAAIGIDPTKTTSIPNYNRQVTTCKKTIKAETNNELKEAPVSNLINQSNFYSSNWINDPNVDGKIYASVVSESSGISFIRLTPRMMAGKVTGFPSVYSISIKTTDNSKFVPLGTYNLQPDNSGVVDIPLGYKLNTKGSLVSVEVSGVDNYGNNYYQLVGIQGCN